MAEPDLTLPVSLENFPTGQDDPRLQPISGVGWQPGEQRRYAIQFAQALSEAEQLDLRQNFGLSLTAYVPKFIYVELVTLDILEALAQHPRYNAAFPFVAAYKISPGIVPPPEGESLPLRAALFPEADAEAIAQELANLGAQDIQVRDLRPRGGLARIAFVLPDTAQIPTIAAIPAVSWIEAVTIVVQDTTAHLGYLETGMRTSRPLAASGLTGDGQNIGVIDGGILNHAHCWFADAPPNTPGPGHRKLIINHNLSGKGDSTHPHFVCGVLAGDDLARPGITFDRGIASDARISFRNQLDFDLPGTGHEFFDYLLDGEAEDAFIHNTSWHFRDDPAYSMISYDVDEFTWAFEDCLVVGSSGNRNEVLGAPSVAKNILCVSAAFTGKNAAGVEVTCFGDGTSGPTADDRRKPEILAPGCGHVSADNGGGCGTWPDTNAGAKETPSWSCAPAGTRCATSFATPVVSAAAAIVRQYLVEGRHPDGVHTPTGALLKAMLLNATAATDNNLGYPNTWEGWGLLQLDRVLPLANEAQRLWYQDIRHEEGLTAGAFHDYDVVVQPGSTPLKITLVWTDPPAQVYSHRDPVVNDLDLEVLAPGGARYLGNRFGGGVSLDVGTSTATDTRNNAEMVLVNSPVAGTWRILVHGVEVNVAVTRQGYALVVTADLAPTLIPGPSRGEAATESRRSGVRAGPVGSDSRSPRTRLGTLWASLKAAIANRVNPSRRRKHLDSRG